MRQIGELVIRYSGTLERYAGDGVMVVFNDPVPVENPALQAVLMALEVREAIGALTETWRRWGHEIGFGIGIAHGFATLGTIGFEGRFDYAAIGPRAIRTVPLAQVLARDQRGGGTIAALSEPVSRSLYSCGFASTRTAKLDYEQTAP